MQYRRHPFKISQDNATFNLKRKVTTLKIFHIYRVKMILNFDIKIWKKL